jgi:glycosyltransferase involved in cell wall biosynthesis
MLCADNEYFEKYTEGRVFKKKYDIMFSGRIVERKNPLFLADVAIKLKEKMGNCTVLIIGDGDEALKKRLFSTLEQNGIDYHFPGFIEHSKLPEFYSQAKLLLFPTTGDCWGVVINEAFASGVPVITTNMTAAAGELVLHGNNGYILPLDSDIWAENIAILLRDTVKLEKFSMSAKKSVMSYNFNEAAQGVIDAFEYLNSKGKEANIVYDQIKF